MEKVMEKVMEKINESTLRIIENPMVLSSINRALIGSLLIKSKLLKKFYKY